MESLNKSVEIKDIPKVESVDYMLCLALDIGEAMLKNGAEIHRVEDTIARFCRAYGAVHTEIFAIPTVIIAAVRMADGAYSSQLRRVYSSSYNMYKVELFNDISRKACSQHPELSALDEMIKAAKKKASYPYGIIVLGAAISTGAFCIFFGGCLIDGILAAIIGAVICFAEKLPQSHVNSFARTAIQSFAAGVLAYLCILCGIGRDPDMIMMGTIMYSIPGLALGISVRDMFYGDFLAGTLKFIHTCLTALMIALGYVLAMLVFSGVPGV